MWQLPSRQSPRPLCIVDLVEDILAGVLVRELEVEPSYGCCLCMETHSAPESTQRLRSTYTRPCRSCIRKMLQGNLQDL